MDNSLDKKLTIWDTNSGEKKGEEIVSLVLCLDKCRLCPVRYPRNWRFVKIAHILLFFLLFLLSSVAFILLFLLHLDL